MSRYRIEIKEFTQELRTVGKDWKLVAPEEYGYTPAVEKVIDIDRTIYIQNCEELDLIEVILAVNGITKKRIVK